MSFRQLLGSSLETSGDISYLSPCDGRGISWIEIPRVRGMSPISACPAQTR